MKLRPYQREAIQAIRETWDGGQPNALIVLATGLGKTVIFCSLGRELRMEGLRRILVLAHRRELIAQAVAKWTAIDPEESVGVYQGTTRDLHADVIVASVASCYPDKIAEEPCPRGCGSGCGECDAGVVRRVARKGRLRELPLAEIDLVIIDEVHHVTQTSIYRRVLDAVREANPAALHLGVTATPFRSDRQSLGWLYDGVSYCLEIQAGIAGGWLSPLRAQRVDLDVDLSTVKISKTTGDYVDEDLGRVMDTESARREVIRAWKEHASDRRTAAYCSTVAAAKHLAEDFLEAGIEARWFSGATKSRLRKEILASYAAGEVGVLCTVGTLTEGWDDPETSCILMLRPTKSRGLLIQIVGRGTRLAPGKDDCLVLDCAGATRLGLMSLADLSRTPEPHGEPPAIDQEDGEEEQEELLPEEPSTVRVVGHSVYEIDLFGGGVHWARINGARVAGVDIGQTVVIFGSGPKHQVLATSRGGIEWLARDVPEREALILAERHCAAHGKERFLRPSSWLTRRPASAKQVALLRRLLAWSREKGSPVDGVDPSSLSMALASAWAGYLVARRSYWDAMVGHW